MRDQLFFPLALLTVGLVPAAVQAAPLPQPVADMISAAAGSPETLKAVVETAKKTNPDSVAEIDAQVASLAKEAEAARVAKIESQDAWEGWGGEGSLGAFISTGNVEDNGVAAGLKFAKETLRWRHQFDLAADYEETSDVVVKERYFAGYAANYKFSERFYAVGVLSAEKDKFAGFKSRFTESVGLGYRVIDRETLKLSFEGGPALRQTDFYDVGSDSTVSGRVAGAFQWTIWPGTVFTQTAAAYLESSNSTLDAISAVTTKLQGDLSARASFDYRHEASPPPGREKTDTTTRMTLVYSF